MSTEVVAEEHQQQYPIPKRPLGGSLLSKNDRLPSIVSMVGLGCSSFSTFFMNRNNSEKDPFTIDQIHSNHPIVQSWMNTIEYAITVAGITLLDTAPWYGHGISEIVIGYALTKLLKKEKKKYIHREALTINTKIGRYEANPNEQFDFTAVTTIKSVERSLQRLCISYIDVLQLHDPEFALSINILFDETIPAMIECQTKGYCRALGITGYPLSVQHQILERSMEIYGRNIWDQSLTYGHYNLHDTSLFVHDKNDLLYWDYCQQYQIQVLAAAPLSMGLLTQRGPPDWHPASTELKLACRSAVDICQQHNVDISTIALLFALSNPHIPTTILGMSTIEEVKSVHTIALRFRDMDTTSLSQNEILQRILSTDERKVLDLLQDRINGPFASVWNNGLYQWDGITIAHDFWKSNFPEQPIIDWQRR